MKRLKFPFILVAVFAFMFAGSATFDAVFPPQIDQIAAMETIFNGQDPDPAYALSGAILQDGVFEGRDAGTTTIRSVAGEKCYGYSCIMTASGKTIVATSFADITGTGMATIPAIHVSKIYDITYADHGTFSGKGLLKEATSRLPRGPAYAKSLVDEADLFASYLYGGTHPGQYSAQLMV